MSVNFSYLLFQSLMLDKGTTTNKVTRYSESRTKCSFLTKSATFLVTRLPTCFFSMLWRLDLRLL